jgi:hypothetical protein
MAWMMARRRAEVLPFTYAYVLHHFMVRGIERRERFDGDHDRYATIDRLGIILEKQNPVCLAWD